MEREKRERVERQRRRERKGERIEERGGEKERERERGRESERVSESERIRERKRLKSQELNKPRGTGRCTSKMNNYPYSIDREDIRQPRSSPGSLVPIPYGLNLQSTETGTKNRICY